MLQWDGVLPQSPSSRRDKKLCEKGRTRANLFIRCLITAGRPRYAGNCYWPAALTPIGSGHAVEGPVLVPGSETPPASMATSLSRKFRATGSWVASMRISSSALQLICCLCRPESGGEPPDRGDPTLFGLPLLCLTLLLKGHKT